MTFFEVGQVIQLGRAEPHRPAHLLTCINGVTWEEAWASRIPVSLDGFQIQAIGKEELMRNKKATGHPQDFADLSRLMG